LIPQLHREKQSPEGSEVTECCVIRALWRLWTMLSRRTDRKKQSITQESQGAIKE